MVLRSGTQPNFCCEGRGVETRSEAWNQRREYPFRDVSFQKVGEPQQDRPKDPIVGFQDFWNSGIIETENHNE